MLSILYLILTTTYSKCSLNPYLNQFQTLIHNMNASTIQYNLYIESTPKDQSISQCSFMNLTTSCCNTQFGLYLSNIIDTYMNQMKDQYFQLEELINSLEQSLNECGYRNYTSFKDSQIGKQELTQYYNILNTIVNLKGGFLQGSLCILCTTNDNSNFIDQTTNKIIVNTQNYQSYKTQLSTQMNTLQTLLTSFKSNFMYYYSQYANTLNCSYQLEIFIDNLQKIQVCPGNDCLGYINQTVAVFENRILSEDDFFIQSTNGGLLIYQQITITQTNIENIIYLFILINLLL